MIRVGSTVLALKQVTAPCPDRLHFRALARSLVSTPPNTLLEPDGPSSSGMPLLPVAGTIPPGGEAPASEGDPRVRGEANQGNVALVAMANLQTPRDRDVTPPGRSEVPLTQPGATPATPGDTSFESGDADGGTAATRGRRSRPRGSGKGSRERQAMGEGPPRTGEEPLDPGATNRPRLLDREDAASRPRRLDREGAAVNRANFAGEKEVAREEDQHWRA